MSDLEWTKVANAFDLAAAEMPDWGDAKVRLSDALSWTWWPKYAYLVKRVDEGDVHHYLTLDMKKAHDVYLKLTKEEIATYMEYHKDEKCELHGQQPTCCGLSSYHRDSGIYTTNYEIEQIELDKFYEGGSAGWDI